MANIRLKPSKCELGGNSVSFLGHKVIEDQRCPDNLNKILEATRPQTKKEVMSFIGLVGFFSSYIPRYASICVPLTDFLRKDIPNPVILGDHQEQSFQTLKNHLLSEPVLKLPRLDKQFVIQTDASDRAIAACILQEHDGVLFPVTFSSKNFPVRKQGGPYQIVKV